MAEYVLLYGKAVVRVIRKDHHGDKRYWLIDYMDNSAPPHHIGFVNKEDCTLLDPALYVLFERKDDDDKTSDARRTG